MRVLLVEDDKELNYSLQFQLEKAGFLVDSCYDGETAVYYISQQIHDIVLLDRMLPLISGTEVLNMMRKQGNTIPVILITAMGSLDDKIYGLDTGADDYLVKPFAFGELLARIRCVTRRPNTLTPNNLLTCGDITYQPEGCILTGKNSTCTLSPKEGCLLETLLRNQHQTLTRESLLIRVWGPDSDVESSNLDNYIYFLRRRLAQTGSTLQIKNIWGVGYRIES